jgi:folate-dependent phosphoribosylglycinamide formyltransferase PurN
VLSLAITGAVSTSLYFYHYVRPLITPIALRYSGCK